jgi:hypothetical protein
MGANDAGDSDPTQLRVVSVWSLTAEVGLAGEPWTIS